MGAYAVFVRLCAVALAGLAISGCANDKTGPWGAAQHLGAGQLATGSLQVVSSASAAGITDQATDAREPLAIKKTLAGKMLTAMALERVTGRKPDPSRLTELD